MQKTYQNCKNEFVIDQNDQDFYAKMDVPYPTWCPQCRLMRRFSFLNWITLYNRSCDKCLSSIISIHNPEVSHRVVCSTCWWADNWDGTEYGMEYDPKRNFFQQLLELKNKSQFMALENLHTSLVNSTYVNATAYQKDCYMCFNADYGEKTAYSMVFDHANECLDCYRVNNCELCYECVGIYKCYKCMYSQELDSCADVLFSYGLSGCTDCFGCVNLRNKSYYIYNVPYSRDEYKQKISGMNLDTRKGIKKAYLDSRAFWLTQPKRCVNGNALNFQTTGDFVYESKNTHDAYMITSAEDSRYVSMLTMGPTKNCYDYTNWGNGAENLYECLTVGEGAYNNKFCVQCWPQAMNNEYCMYVNASKDCFGCINLKKKRYCILNKEYSKEEYEMLRDQIVKDMEANPYIDKAGRIYSYGELFPFEFSPFSYNETMANYFFPLDREQAENKKISWYVNENKKHTPTLDPENIPQKVSDITDSIKSEILECGNCKNGFNIGDLEIYLHEKINTPLPDNCWKCRFKKRFDAVNLPGLYDRNCARCTLSIKTSYPPNSSEIVYCEKCYQQEVV